MEEKNKIEQVLEEIVTRANAAEEENQKLKEANDWGDVAEEEVSLMNNKLQDKHKFFRKLEEEKISTEIFLKSVQRESDSCASRLEACEWDLVEFRHDIPWIEEEKFIAFETEFLLARDQADKSHIWDQIDWTTLQVLEHVGVSVPA